jgi:hypothetical protein
MKMTLTLGFASLALVAVGCGKKSERTIYPLEAADLQSELAAQSLSDSVSAAAAGDGNGSSGLSLNLSASSDPVKTMTRSCAVQDDGSAKVTIASTISLDKSMETTRVKVTHKMTGSSEETRVWSKSGGVTCDNGTTGVHANIAWNSSLDLTGLSLNVTLNRTRTHVISQTNLVRDTTKSRSRSFTMTGERSVTFNSVDSTTDTSKIIVNKSVSGTATRSYKFIDNNAQEQSGSLSIAGNVVVKVTRLAADKSLVSREIVSGTRTATSADNSKVEATYTKFVVTGQGESCQATSGSLALKYFAAGATEASKTVSCTAELGALSCTDETSATVEVESPACDPIDAK